MDETTSKTNEHESSAESGANSAQVGAARRGESARTHEALKQAEIEAMRREAQRRKNEAWARR
jgi:hypothetical protein